MLPIFTLLFFIPQLFALQVTDPYTRFSKLDLPPGPFGPDSVSLDPSNTGPYVGVSDGRILKYNGKEFVDFAYLSPNWTKELCEGVRNLSMGPICGRPLGFSFDSNTGNLYVVGAYGGFYRVSPGGGKANLIASGVNNVKFNYLNGIDVDSNKRVVYFTDTSLVYNFTDALLSRPEIPGDSSGRLIKYDIEKKQLTVLLDKLPRPTGPAVSEDSTFLVYGSFTTQRIFKYHLIGPKKGATEVLIDNLPGFPVKIKRAPCGSFWVPVNVLVQPQPRLVHPFGYKFNSFGGIILKKNFSTEYSEAQVNVVQEYNSLLGFSGKTLFVGSRIVSFVGKYRTSGLL
ncbi:OLC1v1039215C1 [Oldenlandia corymbosa var. corymbosa]|uniref:OLC1v1039215C1 n=1 Tax=Oldenlandia corymbosa var. corymbosa TaxID=529605 RepID=A0AAV1D1L7_OLDCO|nr:OLC1v1039215C1 [Oldenlandia corymbosa var. corymbosa]